MSNGRADRRLSKRDDKYRLRFYGIHEDQLESIDAALAHAREELNTKFDSVALEGLCLHYLQFHDLNCPPKVQ